MLLDERRVATGPGRRPLFSYLRPLGLILFLAAPVPASCVFTGTNPRGARRGRPRVAAVGGGGGGGGGDVGVTAAAVARPWGIPTKLWWTAAMSTAVLHGEPLPTATGLPDPSTLAPSRERAMRLLLSLRGGSEGLKSAKWDSRKAEAGGAARDRKEAGGGYGEGGRFTDGGSRGAAAKVGPTARDGAQPASSPADTAPGAEEEVGCAARSTRAAATELGLGLREEEAGGVGGVMVAAAVKDRIGRSSQRQPPLLSAAGRLEPPPPDTGEGDGRREEARLGEGSPPPGASEKRRGEEREGGEENQGSQEENDRRRLRIGLEGTAASSYGTGVAAAAATPAADADAAGPVGTGAIEHSRGRGQEEVTPPPRPPTTTATRSPPAVGGGATTAVRRRRAVTATATTGGWTRRPAPRAAADGTGTGTVAHAEHLPRAGAPPPPRGEIRVRRPWGRHGAAAPPSAAGVGSGSSGGAGGAASVVGVAGAGGDSAVAPEGEGSGAADAAAAAAAAAATAGEAGTGKVRRMRWEPKYLTVKAVFFLFYSSLGAIMPYLPVYYHTLGIPDRRIGHLGAITPAMTFLFTPLWGALTDKSGMLKQILVLTFAASTLLRVSLPSRTSFPWIISVITLTAVINAPVRPLLDSSALQSLDDRGEYGKQRLWGQWGFGIGSFVTGKLLSRFGFKAAFYMHAAFSLPTLLILLRFSPKKEERGKEPPKFAELYRLVAHDVDVLVFFSMVFAIGLSSGVIENFAYKRLRELGGTGSVLGVSRLISSLSGIPMFFFSGAIVKRFSIVGILTASMMSFIARFVIYACIKNPWAGLPAEALRGVTFAGFWAASTCHVGAIAPPGLSTTMLGLLNATYGGIGQSLGSLIGGSLSNSFGTARAFLVYAGVDTCLLLAFFLFWGLHPNGQQKDRGAGGGIGSSSGGAGAAAGKLQPPPPATAEAPPAATSPSQQDQTFTPPPPPGSVPR